MMQSSYASPIKDRTGADRLTIIRVINNAATETATPITIV